MQKYAQGRMLKGPPLIPRTYISRASIIDPTEGREYVLKYVQKALKQVKRSTMLYADKKQVDNDALCPMNVISKKIWTNLGPILVDLIVKHIIRPQCCKSQILEDLTKIYIIVPTIAL